MKAPTSDVEDFGAGLLLLAKICFAQGLLVALLAGLILTLSCGSVRAAESAPFDARATLARAGVGQYSTRPAPLPLVDIRPSKARRGAKKSDYFERMECRPDYADPEITVCEIKETTP